MSVFSSVGSIWTKTDAKMGHEKFHSYRCAYAFFGDLKSGNFEASGEE
jgi:hypothetical protein